MHVDWMDHLKWVRKKADDSSFVPYRENQLWWEEEKKAIQRLSSYLYLFSYVYFPMEYRSEMSPVVVKKKEKEKRWRRRKKQKLSTHYVTSHPLANEKRNEEKRERTNEWKSTLKKVNTRTALRRVQLSLSDENTSIKRNVNKREKVREREREGGKKSSR